jgi:hypothetical protein
MRGDWSAGAEALEREDLGDRIDGRGFLCH